MPCLSAAPRRWIDASFAITRITQKRDDLFLVVPRQRPGFILAGGCMVAIAPLETALSPHDSLRCIHRGFRWAEDARAIVLDELAHLDQRRTGGMLRKRRNHQIEQENT